MQAYATPATGSAPQLRLVGSPTGDVAAPVLDPAAEVFSDLVGRLVELVAERVAARLEAPQQQHADEWLDSRRAAEYLGIGRDSVRRLAAEKSIPTEQAGAGCKLFFRRADLDAWRCSAVGPIETLRGQRHG